LVASPTRGRNSHDALRELRSGCRDPSRKAQYLLKDRVFDVATVVDALRRIMEGETVIDPTIVSKLVGRRRREDPLAELTPREREVLGVFAEGMSNGAIARHLFLTERTVEAHVTQIFQKLGLFESPDQHRRVLAVLKFLRS
jgi:DNA-binding NarL/FixJ family response regulator